MPVHSPHLEIRSATPPERTRGTRPPLLFVHGGYCDAWCWEHYFLPWFAARGYRASALSLRGHGKSEGHDTLFGASLDDYAADVLHVARTLGDAPVLVGHSMGAAVVERIIQRHALPGAALLAPIPPSGLIPIATRLVAEQPEYMLHMSYFNPSRLSSEVMSALRPFYFTDRVDAELLVEAALHFNSESPRALFDLSLRVPFGAVPSGTPILVLGASGDRICRPDDVITTAEQHGVTATIVPGLAHMMMLEPDWERVSLPLLRWVETLRPARA
ncbi:MAG: alpha/beta fold hydrolase [Proteobacteria bacterium]|nr:alpha/beta fold hydrolase [Pseudomonadota bacterium]